MAVGVGAGPVVSERLAPFAPLPLIGHDRTGLLHQDAETRRATGDQPFGRMCAFMSRWACSCAAPQLYALAGADGLEAGGRGRGPIGELSPRRPQGCRQRALSRTLNARSAFEGRVLKDTGVTLLDFAPTKAPDR